LDGDRRPPLAHRRKGHRKRNQEEAMRSALILSIVLGLAQTVPSAAHTRTAAHRTIHHWSVMAKVTALAPAIGDIPLPPTRDPEGLSRHHDDCNMGCIDH
jgi:hypothetical protein